jgi:hypothetical protein
MGNLSLIPSPLVYKINVAGHVASEIPASTVIPQPRPRLVVSPSLLSGKNAPTSDRKIEVDADIVAAYWGAQSTRYICTGICGIIGLDKAEHLMPQNAER